MSPSRYILSQDQLLSTMVVGIPDASLGWPSHFPPFFKGLRLRKAFSLCSAHPSSSLLYCLPIIAFIPLRMQYR